MRSKVHTQMQWALFQAGPIAIITVVCILGFLGIRINHREWKKQKLVCENPVGGIADLNIKALLGGNVRKRHTIVYAGARTAPLPEYTVFILYMRAFTTFQWIRFR